MIAFKVGDYVVSNSGIQEPDWCKGQVLEIYEGSVKILILTTRFKNCYNGLTATIKKSKLNPCPAVSTTDLCVAIEALGYQIAYRYDQAFVRDPETQIWHMIKHKNTTLYVGREMRRGYINESNVVRDYVVGYHILEGLTIPGHQITIRQQALSKIDTDRAKIIKNFMELNR